MTDKTIPDPVGSTAEQPAPGVPATLSAASPGRPVAIIPRNLAQAMELAMVVVRSGLAPRGLATPERAAYAMLYGAELGLPPMAALKSVMIVNGVPSLYGDAILGLVRKSGLLESIKEVVERDDKGTPTSATCTVKRRGESNESSWTYSMADAAAAGLLTPKQGQGPGPWKTATPRMLLARARTFALRDRFPDVLTGPLNLPTAGEESMMTIDGDAEFTMEAVPAEEPQRDDQGETS
jgi:RecT family protein